MKKYLWNPQKFKAQVDTILTEGIFQGRYFTSRTAVCILISEELYAVGLGVSYNTIIKWMYNCNRSGTVPRYSAQIRVVEAYFGLPIHALEDEV